MNSELYCLWYDNYVKLLPEHQTEECNDYPHKCYPEECEQCEVHCFDEDGDRID